jgi:hypothetical protein
MVEYKLFPWFDEAISAHAHLNYPLFGISQPIQQLFPKYTSPNHKSVKVFAATLDFAGPSGGVPKDVCLKLARGVDEVVRLSHEASVYRKQLSKLWGIAVPKMYGFFIGHYEDTPVACLLLELCVGPTVLPSDSEAFVYVLFPFFFSVAGNSPAPAVAKRYETCGRCTQSESRKTCHSNCIILS